MDARQTPAASDPAKDALQTKPVPGAYDDTSSQQGPRSGSVGVYDRPQSAPRSWSSLVPVLLVIALILAALVVYFFVR